MGKEPNTAVSEPKKGIISSVLGFFGRLAIAPGKMLIYPVWPIKVIRSVEVTWPVKFTLPLVAYPENWRKSFGEIWHDFKNGLRGLINSPPKKYDKPIGMSQGTKYFSVIVTSNRKDHEKGVVTFEGSKVFIGDIPYLTNEQLKKIKAKLPNVSISREKNEIVIEIDVKQIVTNHELLKKIREEFGPNVSEEAIKTLAIAREIDRNFKELAKITGGELEKHTDLKFLWDTAEKLFSKNIEDEKKSAEVVTPVQSGKSSERIVHSSEDPSRVSAEDFKRIGKELSETMSASSQSDNAKKKPQEFINRNSASSRIRGF